MKLNMGCGLNRMPGWVNVDSSPAAEPDELVDLEVTPWPWADDSVEAVFFNHSLEHMGHAPQTFLAIVKELYRVCRDGAVVRIHVPHPRHDDFLNDPTHVRAITPPMMQLFDRAFIRQAQRAGAANTPLSLYLNVDLALVRGDVVLDEPHATRLRSGALSRDEVHELVQTRFNIAKELRMELRAHKPPRPAAVSP